jgi:hypothetical protein
MGNDTSLTGFRLQALGSSKTIVQALKLLLEPPEA